jgi:hypothetical protein
MNNYELLNLAITAQREQAEAFLRVSDTMDELVVSLRRAKALIAEFKNNPWTN